jgi:hypothetical protein
MQDVARANLIFGLPCTSVPDREVAVHIMNAARYSPHFRADHQLAVLRGPQHRLQELPLEDLRPLSAPASRLPSVSEYELSPLLATRCIDNAKKIQDLRMHPFFDTLAAGATPMRSTRHRGGGADAGGDRQAAQADPLQLAWLTGGS